MKNRFTVRSKFTDAQILFAIKQSKTGVRVEEVWRKIDISEATFTIGRRKSSMLICDGPTDALQLTSSKNLDFF